jgi:leucyl aminopeptidase
MRSAYAIPRISSSAATVSAAQTELLIVPVHDGATGGVVDQIDKACGGDLHDAITRGEFHSKVGESLHLRVQATGWAVGHVLVIGAGKADDVESARRVGAAGIGAARGLRRANVAFAIDGWSPTAIETLAEGATVANFDGGSYKTRDANAFFVSDIQLLGAAPDASQAIARGLVVGEAVNRARMLVNEPGNELPPRVFVERATEMAAVPNVIAEILDEKALESLGMGLLLGVGRGSAEPPRMLVLRYVPPGAPESPVLGLVGKGITFDTGGISIKPSDGMERMKDDMAGGATVVAALRAIALERLPLRVTAVVPSAENMPGSRATRPGDVLRGASGLTVEVNNTDAEGRLVLGDGLWYAARLGATHLVDVATLTGACVVALGRTTTGLFGSPDSWVDAVEAAAGRGGEKAWPLPLFDDYRDLLKSEIADLLNSPGRPAGAITAAMFLKEFAGGLPWAHLDIAGTAWAEDNKPWMPKGATGVMVRTLVETARGLAARS